MRRISLMRESYGRAARASTLVAVTVAMALPVTIAVTIAVIVAVARRDPVALLAPLVLLVAVGVAAVNVAVLTRPDRLHGNRHCAHRYRRPVTAMIVRAVPAVATTHVVDVVHDIHVVIVVLDHLHAGTH